MGQFRYLGATYFGLDPQQVTFQRQASSDTCWAACLANAGSVLYGRPVATDQDIVRAAHLEGLKNKGLKKAHVVEMVNFVSPVSQVMQKVFRQVSKKNQTDSFEDRFALVKEMEGNLKSATPYPF